MVKVLTLVIVVVMAVKASAVSATPKTVPPSCDHSTDKVIDGVPPTAVLVDVTAVGGTPSMTLSVEWSQDGGTVFGVAETADAFTAITTTITKVKTFTIKGNFY